MPNGDAQQSASALNHWLKTQKIHSAGQLSKGIALGAFNGIVMVAQMALLANIIDLAVFKKLELTDLQPWLLGLMGLVLVRALLLFASERYNRRGAMAIKQHIRGQLLARLFELGPRFSHHYGTAKLSTLLHQGVDSLEDYFAGYLPVIAYCSVIPGAILLAVFPNDWRSGLVLILTAPLVPFFMILIGHQAQKLNQQHWARLLRMSSHFLDVIQGLTQLKIFNASRREINAVKEISEDFGNQTMAILKVAFLSSFMLEFLASIAIALVAVILGFRLLYGEVDYVLALWVLLLAPEFYLPFRQLGAQYHAKMAGVSAAQDMIDILQDNLLADEFLENSRQVLTYDQTVSESLSIELTQVYFNYPKRKNCLEQVNLSFVNNGLHAIVGASGAGKSTLIDLLLGFITPTAGNIRVNGQHLDANNRDSWIINCGWVAQKAHLFFGSIAFNVCLEPDLLDDKKTQQRILSALKMAGLSQFVKQQPRGLFTEISEAGLSLSGGQAQRLALARAFYHQPKLLILDEPSSNLDFVTEQIIQRAITQYAKEHLVIVIAHRLNTIVDAKNIIVLADGKVIEQGTHQQLLNNNGAYAAAVVMSEKVHNDV